MGDEYLKALIDSYNPDDDIRRYGGRMGSWLADRMVAEAGGLDQVLAQSREHIPQKSVAEPEREEPQDDRRRSFDYVGFYNAVNASGLRPMQILDYFDSSVEAKADLLIRFGLRNATVKGGDRVPLKSARPRRIQEIFQSRFMAGEKKANSQQP